MPPIFRAVPWGRAIQSIDKVVPGDTSDVEGTLLIIIQKLIPRENTTFLPLVRPFGAGGGGGEEKDEDVDVQRIFRYATDHAHPADRQAEKYVV